MSHAKALLDGDFATLSDLIAAQAADRGDQIAVTDGSRSLSYADLDQAATRIAAALQRDGGGFGHVAAICATAGLAYVQAFVGILRAAMVVSPLAPSGSPATIAAQLRDSDATFLFLDRAVADAIAPAIAGLPVRRIALDDCAAGEPLATWAVSAGPPIRHEIAPDDPFNLIYSSGTTGTPKGIVQPHRMRWAHIRRSIYPADAVTLVSTPLYSNTTLVSLIPTLAAGGTVVLMPRFDAAHFLALSQEWRVTHAMLVPVQYRRLLDHPDFASYDLTSYRMKFATSSPFPAETKREVLERWPGGLTEFYGMTEGGGTCALAAHLHPDKLHTVGRPLPGHDVRLIDADGKQTAAGEVGEVVGRSSAMMTGYHNRSDATDEATWRSPTGERYIRTGDLGRFDDDGFLTLVGRRKDMIISGGFNIYPGDLEAALTGHPAVREAAVIGGPSPHWGETPVGFVALRDGVTTTGDAVREAVNATLGRTQRLSAVHVVASLPRSHIGKVVKQALHDLAAMVD